MVKTGQAGEEYPNVTLSWLEVEYGLLKKHLEHRAQLFPVNSYPNHTHWDLQHKAKQQLFVYTGKTYSTLTTFKMSDSLALSKCSSQEYYITMRATSNMAA